MGDEFHWRCPFCERDTTITSERYSSNTHEFHRGNVNGTQYFRSEVIVCPHPDCRRYALRASLHNRVVTGTIAHVGPAREKWHLIPAAEIRAFPDYIPPVILADYREACLIRELSPKASATLARRCLQGIVRDFWKVSKPRLVDEIEAIRPQIDPLTWTAIDAVRKVGNIGAHMERDINLVIDVDAGEATLLIQLVETLLTEWYVARFERERRMKELTAIAAAKKAP
jgi:hypothetical protein